MDTLDAGEEDEPILFKNVQHLDPLLESWFSSNEPNYRHHFSRKTGFKYLANLCPSCGANFGDHFLHEMGGAFSPIEPQEAEMIGLVKLPFHGEFPIEAEWVMGVGKLLLEFAQRRVRCGLSKGS